MNCRGFVLRACVAAIVYLAANRCFAQTPPTKGSLIMPKSWSIRIPKTPGDAANPEWVDQAKIGWPAQVQATNGQWLQIADEGGYTSGNKAPRGGWVRKDDVLQISPAESALVVGFTSRINQQYEVVARGRQSNSQPSVENQKLARLYWLRGLFWALDALKGGGDQPQLALEDFIQATNYDSNLADAWVQQGRMWAKLDPMNTQSCWVAAFNEAYRRYPPAKPTKVCGRWAAGTGAKLAQAPPEGTTNNTPLGLPSSSVLAQSPAPQIPPRWFFEVGRAYEGLYDARCNAVLLDGKQAASGIVQPLTPQSIDAVAEAANASAEAAAASGRAAVESAGAVAIGNDDAVAQARAAITKGTGAIRNAVDKLNRARIELAAGTDFDSSLFYYGQAEKSNRFWFRPPSAQGDLYLARIKNVFVSEDGYDRTGRPKLNVSADDVLNAIEHYKQSIRLNDGFDESLRGLANGYWYLEASVKLAPPKRFPSDAQMGAFFKANSDTEKTRARLYLLDLGYEAAKRASFAAYDRNPKNLRTQAQIDIELAWTVQAHRGIDYLARAADTLNDAFIRSPSNAERRDTSKFVISAQEQQFWLSANLAGQTRMRFAAIRKRAENLSKCIDDLWRKSSSLSRLELDDPYFKLVMTIDSAYNAIREIRAMPLEVDSTKLLTSQGVTAYGAGLWPDELAARDELVRRFARIAAWTDILDKLSEHARRYATDPKCPLKDELRCVP